MSGTLNVDIINTGKAGSIASQATLPASFWTIGNLIPISGTAAISAIGEASKAGVSRVILAEGAFTLTSSANFLAAGGTQRQSLFLIYDKKANQYRRYIDLGIMGAKEKLTLWNNYASALEAINDIDFWFRNPIWPEMPKE